MSAAGIGAPGEPAWLRELRTALSVNSQIVLYGNVRDNFLRPMGQNWDVPGISDFVWWGLQRDGYPFLAVVDAIAGLRVVPDTPEAAKAFHDLTGLRPGHLQRPDLAEVAHVLTAVTAAPSRCAVAIDYASRLVSDAARLDPDEHAFFAACERLSHTAPLRPGATAQDPPLYNPVIWIVQNERDLPVWLTAGNDSIRKIAVPRPDYGTRRQAASWLAATLPGFRQAAPDAQAELPDRFAEQTQGLGLRGLLEITRLARRLGTPVDQIDEAVRSYRVGVHDNPWRAAHLRTRLTGAVETIGARVSGQKEAIQHSVDILVRSVLGLSGAHAGGNASRPRGVLLFVGPTGVGKTQLAKELTQTIFGDSEAYIRFDMSEFSAEHAADRLIGAPPGYVGHDAGGELTNAVRERPFSLILFDEIEKAHPRILDKFLQILDDGRLTDGSGSTVYFSEAVLVFTSNLGVSTVDAHGVRQPLVNKDMPRDELEGTVRDGVKRHFVEVLNRPELLNRFGDNLVVFNFIDDDAAVAIFDGLIRHVSARLEKEHEMTLELAPAVRARLLEEATGNLANGGRGIGSVIESALVNPLSRELFERGVVPGSRVRVVGLDRPSGSWSVRLEFLAQAPAPGRPDPFAKAY